MANNTLKTRILLVSKTTAEWATNSTVLLKGELGIEFLADGGAKFKVGDGTKTFAQLSYATMTPAEITEAINTAVQAASHSHANKEILDAIEVAFTTADKTKYDEAATKAGSAVQKIKINGVEQTKTDGEIDLPAYPTKESLSLDKVENVAPADLPVSTATQAELDKKANASDVYTKEQTNSAISTAVANAEHLKRSIVDALPEVSEADAHTIYMVAKKSGAGDQKYDEYMLINGAFEKIGDSTVDLTDYATKTEVTTAKNEAISDAEGKLAAKVGEIGEDTVKKYVDDAKKAATDYADGLAGNYATADQGKKADSAVQSVKIGDTEYKTGTNVVLPEYPTTLPASDVHDWAKAETKPEYTKDEVGLGKVDNTADAEKVVASAGKFTTARNIAIDGAVKAAAVSFNGTEDVTLQVTEIDAAKLKVASADTLILDGNF